MHKIFSMTVSESKRLIAKGVAQSDMVKQTMENGTLAIGSGTTNGYLIEEITGERFDKKNLVTGRTVPSNYSGPKMGYTHPDLVIRKGERLDIKGVEALNDMGPGDIYVKGANALNYEKNQVGVLIGHPTGGTVGSILGTIIARRITLLQPVGLEKNMGEDLIDAAELMNGDPEGKGPTLWVTPGYIFTEIEALEVLAGVDVVQVGAGGVGGAEGAVWLAVFGETDQLEKAEAVIESVRGEVPFTES